MIKVAPSILSANFNNLLEEVQSVKEANYLHIDVMDGHFVPNISLGALVYKNLRPLIDMTFDVHLMISDPYKYALDFIKAGADIITFHLEAVKNKQDIINLINLIHENNVKAGISIKPNTKVEELIPYLPLIDLVLVMSVEPGFGGQKFMPQALDKIAYLKNIRDTKNLNYEIEVDGGINHDTALQCVKKGVDILVAGTYIFKSTTRSKVIKDLQNL